MSKNFVSYADAQALMEETGKKKLTVTDTMPAASPSLLDNTKLYIGADTSSLVKGGVYQCQALEVTPAGSENPQSEGWYVYNSVSEEYELTTDTSVVSGTTYYEIKWVNISTAEVDLSHYKTIWGGSSSDWEQLTDAQKAEYEYQFFNDDNSGYSLKIADTVQNGNMLPVTSNAVYDYTVDSVTDGNMHPVTSNAVADEVDDLDAEIADVVNYYGAKNMMSTPYYSADGLESNGITYTVNPDGSVTANGTATANSTFYYFHNVKGSTCQFINGCIFNKLTDGSGNTFFMSINATLDPWTPYCRLTNEGEKEISGIPNDDTLIDGIIRIASGTTVTNKTFYPMIRKPGIKNDTFVPYAMTNKKLTDGYNTISRRFLVVVSNAFGTFDLPDDWKSGYRWIYFLMNYNNMAYLLQPTVLPTESLATTKNYAISYNDGISAYVCMFNISTDNKVTVSKIHDSATPQLTGCWFCLVR